MAQPTPTMGALAWACSPWTPRKMGTRSLWPATRALQVGLQATAGMGKGKGSLAVSPAGRTKAVFPGQDEGFSLPPPSPHWSSHQPHEACRVSPVRSPILQVSKESEPGARNQDS